MNLLSPKPVLARPVVHLFRPSEVISVAELGCLEYAKVLWNLDIRGHPVLVKDTMEKILDAGSGTCSPHVAFMGQSNVGKSTLVNALLSQHNLNRVDVNRLHETRDRANLARGRFEPVFPLGHEDADGRITMTVPGGGGGGACRKRTSAVGGAAGRTVLLEKSTSSGHEGTSSGRRPGGVAGAENNILQMLKPAVRAFSILSRSRPRLQRSQQQVQWKQHMKIIKTAETRRARSHYGKLVRQGVKAPGWALQSKLCRDRGKRAMEETLKQRIIDTNKVLKRETVGTTSRILADNVKAYCRELNLVKAKRRTLRAARETGTKPKIDHKQLGKQLSPENLAKKKASLVKIDHTEDRAFTKKVHQFMLREGRIDKAARKLSDDPSNKLTLDSNEVTFSGLREPNTGNWLSKAEWRAKRRQDKLEAQTGGTGVHPHDRSRGKVAGLQDEQNELQSVDGKSALPYSLNSTDGNLVEQQRERQRQVRGRQLFNAPSFAPVSRTAGRTRQLFRFEIGGRLMLIDLPGYGFAGKAGKHFLRDWELMMDAYLEVTKPVERLKRIVSLIDVNLGFTDRDEKLWDMCLNHQIPIQIVLTKCDKSNPWKLHNCMEQMLNLAQQVHADGSGKDDATQQVIHPYIHAVSALENIGMQELRVSLASIARDEENLMKIAQARF